MQESKKRTYRWCEFTIKGSSGGLRSWHLVTLVGNAYRSICGRLLTATPEAIMDTAPTQIRGVCRLCERRAKLDKTIAPALLR